jgi:hypothetical protein
MDRESLKDTQAERGAPYSSTLKTERARLSSVEALDHQVAKIRVVIFRRAILREMPFKATLQFGVGFVLAEFLSQTLPDGNRALLLAGKKAPHPVHVRPVRQRD